MDHNNPTTRKTCKHRTLTLTDCPSEYACTECGRLLDRKWKGPWITCTPTRKPCKHHALVDTMDPNKRVCTVCWQVFPTKLSMWPVDGKQDTLK